MTRSHWRDRCRPIIERVLREHRGASDKTLRRLLREVYPFGGRKNHPYKIWLSELHKQMGTESPKKQEEADPRQLTFEESDDE